MMNESLIRLVTVLVGKWKKEHLATVILKAEVKVCHDTWRLSVLGSQNMCLHPLACCVKKKMKWEWREEGKRTEWLGFLGRECSESEAD